MQNIYKVAIFICLQPSVSKAYRPRSVGVSEGHRIFQGLSIVAHSLWIVSRWLRVARSSECHLVGGDHITQVSNKEQYPAPGGFRVSSSAGRKTSSERAIRQFCLFRSRVGQLGQPYGVAGLIKSLKHNT